MSHRAVNAPAVSPGPVPLNPGRITAGLPEGRRPSALKTFYFQLVSATTPKLNIGLLLLSQVCQAALHGAARPPLEQRSLVCQTSKRHTRQCCEGQDFIHTLLEGSEAAANMSKEAVKVLLGHSHAASSSPAVCAAAVTDKTTQPH